MKRFINVCIIAILHLQILSIVPINGAGASSLKNAVLLGLGLDIEGEPGFRRSFTYQSYQTDIVCASSNSPLKPKTLAGLQNVVKYALSTNQSIKAFGSLHSVTDCICTVGIPVNMSYIDHFSYDPVKKLATVGAGATLRYFQENLHRSGRALHSAPSAGEITVGGCLGTGAHGSSLLHPGTLSDQIVAVTLIDGNGQVKTITENDEDFKAVRVHLGLLGIIYEVVFNTIDQYKLQVVTSPISDKSLTTSQLLTMARENDMFQYWWFPSSNRMVLSNGTRVSTHTPGECESHLIPETSKLSTQGVSFGMEIIQSTRDEVGSYLLQSYNKLGLYKTVPGRSPLYSDQNTGAVCSPLAVGYSNYMMTSSCEQCFWKQGSLSFYNQETSIVIPVSQFDAALTSIKEIIKEYPVEFPMNGIYFRFLRSSDAYMAMNSGVEVVCIDIITVPRHDKSQPKLGLPAYQAIAQALVVKHEGRPHWGKNGLYFSNRNLIQDKYPELPEFQRVMRKMDPQRIFLNDFGRRVLQESDDMTVTDQMAQHCGLNDVCLCQSDLDCGKESWKDYTCGNLLGYTVCKEKYNFFDEMRSQMSRQLIGFMTSEGTNLEVIVGQLMRRGII